MFPPRRIPLGQSLMPTSILRKEAKRVLDMDEFIETMSGIKALVKEDTLDESPFAYKNIFDVMRLQADLVEIVAHVSPIINIKG